MQDWENRQPGRLMGAPLTSIYEGLRLPDGSLPEEDDEPETPVDAPASRLGSVAAS